MDRGRSSGPTTQWIRREGGDCEVKRRRTEAVLASTREGTRQLTLAWTFLTMPGKTHNFL